jgi:uncharacterized protein (DUF488 family)
MSDSLPSPATVFTVGHSNRERDEFRQLLKAHGVTWVLDVRKMPRSRSNPQFNIETLPSALQTAGIGYTHLPGLGGLRRPRPDSRNGGWQNRSFQAYADYMLTPDFSGSLQEVLDRARAEVVVLMCAEAVPWRCHRSLIADALVVRAIPVQHILSPTRLQPHLLRDWARVEGLQITYPPAPPPRSRPRRGPAR